MGKKKGDPEGVDAGFRGEIIDKWVAKAKDAIAAKSSSSGDELADNMIALMRDAQFKTLQAFLIASNDAEMEAEAARRLKDDAGFFSRLSPAEQKIVDQILQRITKASSAGAILESGNALTDLQQRIINEAIASCSATDEAGNIIMPGQLPEAACKILDPDSVLMRNNVKIYALDGLNEKIKALAAASSTEFNDTLLALCRVVQQAQGRFL